MLGVAKAIKGLYILDATSFSQSVIQSFSSKSHCVNSLSTIHANKTVMPSINDVNIWHQRLGHASDIVMKHLDNIKSIFSSSSTQCLVCPLAKQHRISFPKNTIHSTELFGILHADV